MMEGTTYDVCTRVQQIIYERKSKNRDDDDERQWRKAMIAMMMDGEKTWTRRRKTHRSQFETTAITEPQGPFI